MMSKAAKSLPNCRKITSRQSLSYAESRNTKSHISMAENLMMSDLKKFDASDMGCIPSFDRMNSCLGPATTSSLLWALEKDNLQLFSEQLMDLDLEEINEEVGDASFTILHLVAQSGKVNFMQELMTRRDVNPNTPHKTLKKYPVHFAAEKGDADMIGFLLKCGADVNARMENGDTILHILAKRSGLKWMKNDEGIKEIASMQGNFARSIQIAINTHGVNIDCENKIGLTPIFFAVTKGSEEVAKMLLKTGACVTTETDDGDTVEELIQQKMPNLAGCITGANKENKDTIENKLFQLLYFESYEPGKFLEEWGKAESNNNKVQVNADNGNYTFLQFCCDQGHDKLVRFLLEKGADPNKFCENYQIPPVVLAAHHGYYKVLQVFKQWTMEIRKGSVDFCAVHEVKKENILHKILKAESKAHQNVSFRDYDKCLTIILDEHRVFHKLILPAINAQDQLGNTPLHMAAQTGNTSAIRKLLNAEANIGLKNFQQEVPIAHIPPLVMMEFLDDCVQGNNIPSDQEFQITFNYSFLGPPLKESLAKTFSSESPLMSDENEANDDSPKSFNDLPEAEPLWYIAQLPDHRPLLTHPVITSFLCMKWRRIRPYYYINLLFYLLFVGCLTAYLVLLNIDLQNEELKKAALKNDSWRNKDPLVFSEYKNGWVDRITQPTLVLLHVNAILLIILSLRELFQMVISFRRYVFGNGYINWENFLELTMISISWYLVVGGEEIVKDYEKPSFGWTTRSLSATAILLAWWEMVLMIGRHPKLSIYVTMLQTVGENFLRFLSWGIFIIISFGLAFTIIFARAKPEKGKEAKNEYFENPSKALMKTIVMSLTGEMEFAGIDFADIEYFQIIFLVWVFLIMLVLMNLLNGLAVSDIAKIQKEAEILSYVSRVDAIAFIESMLLGDPFEFLTNWPPLRWSKFLPACNCYHRLSRKQFCINACFNKLIGNTLLFVDRLSNKKAVFYPNQSKKERSPLPGTPGMDERITKLVMDQTILDNAKALIIQKQEKNTLDEMKEKLKHMEKILGQLSQQQNLIVEKLSA